MKTAQTIWEFKKSSGVNKFNSQLIFQNCIKISPSAIWSTNFFTNKLAHEKEFDSYLHENKHTKKGVGLPKIHHTGDSIQSLICGCEKSYRYEQLGQKWIAAQPNSNDKIKAT